MIKGEYQSNFFIFEGGESSIDFISLAISAVAIIVTIFIGVWANNNTKKANEKAEKANKIAKDANELAKNANSTAKKMLKENLRKNDLDIIFTMYEKGLISEIVLKAFSVNYLERYLEKLQKQMNTDYSDNTGDKYEIVTGAIREKKGFILLSKANRTDKEFHDKIYQFKWDLDFISGFLKYEPHEKAVKRFINQREQRKNKIDGHYPFSKYEKGKYLNKYLDKITDKTTNIIKDDECKEYINGNIDLKNKCVELWSHNGYDDDAFQKQLLEQAIIIKVKDPEESKKIWGEVKNFYLDYPLFKELKSLYKKSEFKNIVEGEK